MEAHASLPLELWRLCSLAHASPASPNVVGGGHLVVSKLALTSGTRNNIWSSEQLALPRLNVPLWNEKDTHKGCILIDMCISVVCFSATGPVHAFQLENGAWKQLPNEDWVYNHIIMML